MRRLRDDDSGLSLVELMVYIFLGIIVSTIVSSILINSLRVQAQVTDAAQSADAVTTVADSIGRGVRNSSAMQESVPAPGGVLVRARSLDSTPATTTELDGQWVCLAWYAIDGRIYSRVSDAAIVDPVTTAPADWTLIASDLDSVGGAPLLDVSSDGISVEMSFTARTGDGGPQLIQSVVTSLQPTSATSPVRESGSCF